MTAFRRYVFAYAESNMYVFCENESALVIDPNVCEEALAYLKENNVREITVLLTHEHYDHTSGLTWLMQHFNGNVVCHEETADSLRNGRNNRPLVIAANRMGRLSGDEVKALARSLPQGYRYDPQVTFVAEYAFMWQGHAVRLKHCPGHSRGSCCIELGGGASVACGVIATGDSLIRNTPVITRFRGGSEKDYTAVTLPYLKQIDGDTLILPGHGEPFYMKEERGLYEED